MASVVFDDLLAKGIRQGQVPAREKAARDWYRNAARKYGGASGVDENVLMRSVERDRFKNRVQVGSMYMFFYDPKHKKTLPYYDQFPLIFPFKQEKGALWGLNLHYLPHQYRAKLMDALYDLTTNERYDEKTKLELSYETLNGVSRFKYFKPCVKMYLREHLRSRFMYVYPSEWDIALWLPLERFEKATKSKVWADSRRIING